MDIEVFEQLESIAKSDSNEERIQSFTVRHEEDKKFNWIIGPFLLPVSQLYELAIYWSYKMDILIGSGKRNHATEVGRVQVGSSHIRGHSRTTWFFFNKKNYSRSIPVFISNAYLDFMSC